MRSVCRDNSLDRHRKTCGRCNLLTVILSYSSSLSQELAKDSRQQHAAEQVAQAAEHGAALTRQMLVFSRQQVFQLKVLNLNDIILNLTTMLQRIIGAHNRHQYDVGGEFGAGEGRRRAAGTGLYTSQKNGGVIKCSRSRSPVLVLTGFLRGSV